MFLELIFSDAGSVRDYLERRSKILSISLDGSSHRVMWHDMLMSQVLGINHDPFIWYDGNYHLDINVKQLKDAFDFLPRYKWDNHMDGLIVYWGFGCSCSHGMQIYRFDENWLWSNKVLRELIQDESRLTTPIKNIHNTMNLNLAVYWTRNIREYIPVYPQTESKLSLFELSFQSISDLEKYLCAYENDSRMEFVMTDEPKAMMYVDPNEAYSRRYPLVIHRKPLYDGQPDTYLVDVYARDKLATHASRYRAEVHEIETKGHYVGEPSPRWYVKTDTYGFFQMHEGRYRFRTYKPDWTPDRDKTYMLCARGNGKSLRQLKEAFEHYMTTGDPIVAVNRKISIHDMYPTKPILKFDDLDEKTLKYVDTDVKASVECYNVFNKELKERMNIMFGVDLNRIPEIKDVKFNNPATIVFWADGTKTVVKRQKGDRFDKEKGLAMAIVKKLYGNKARYNDLFKKWIKEDK